MVWSVALNGVPFPGGLSINVPGTKQEHNHKIKLSTTNWDIKLMEKLHIFFILITFGAASDETFIKSFIVYEWINNSIPHFMMCVNTYPC